MHLLNNLGGATVRTRYIVSVHPGRLRRQELTAAEATLRQVKAALHNAQSAYNQMAWANDIGARPESLRLEQTTFEYERELRRGMSAAITK